MLWLDHFESTGSVSAVRCDLLWSSCFSHTDCHVLGKWQVPPWAFNPGLSSFTSYHFLLWQKRKSKCFYQVYPSLPSSHMKLSQRIKKTFSRGLAVSNLFFPSIKLKGQQWSLLQKCRSHRALYENRAGWTTAYHPSIRHPPEMLTQHAFFQRASEVVNFLQDSKKARSRKERRKGNMWYKLA